MEGYFKKIAHQKPTQELTGEIRPTGVESIQ
jgi:hypothetical protein